MGSCEIRGNWLVDWGEYLSGSSGSPTEAGRDWSVRVCSSLAGVDPGQYIHTACERGSKVVGEGNDMEARTCSTEIPPGHFIVDGCVKGSLFSAGHDAVFQRCKDVQPGSYVAEPCDTGTYTLFVCLMVHFIGCLLYR